MGEPETVSSARAYLASCNRRDRVVANLREPAWRMLIDLYVQAAQDRQVNVTSACIASGRPMTTALRALDSLECAGLACRRENNADGRGHFIEVTENGSAAVEALFSPRPLPETPDCLHRASADRVLDVYVVTVPPERRDGAYAVAYLGKDESARVATLAGAKLLAQLLNMAHRVACRPDLINRTGPLGTPGRIIAGAVAKALGGRIDEESFDHPKRRVAA